MIVVNLPLNEGRQAKFVVRRSFNPPPPPRTLTYFPSFFLSCWYPDCHPCHPCHQSSFPTSSSSSLPPPVCVAPVCVSAGRRLVFQKHTHMQEMRETHGLDDGLAQESAPQHTRYKR